MGEGAVSPTQEYMAIVNSVRPEVRLLGLHHRRAAPRLLRHGSSDCGLLFDLMMLIGCDGPE